MLIRNQQVVRSIRIAGSSFSNKFSIRPSGRDSAFRLWVHYGRTMSSLRRWRRDLNSLLWLRFVSPRRRGRVVISAQPTDQLSTAAVSQCGSRNVSLQPWRHECSVEC